MQITFIFRVKLIAGKLSLLHEDSQHFKAYFTIVLFGFYVFYGLYWTTYTVKVEWPSITSSSKLKTSVYAFPWMKRLDILIIPLLMFVWIIKCVFKKRYIYHVIQHIHSPPPLLLAFKGGDFITNYFCAYTYLCNSSLSPLAVYGLTCHLAAQIFQFEEKRISLQDDPI